MISAKSLDVALPENRRERKTRSKRALKRRLLVFLKDLDFYIDFCIARFLVWREMRRRN